jgi:hypothetical protein
MSLVTEFVSFLPPEVEQVVSTRDAWLSDL